MKRRILTTKRLFRRKAPKVYVWRSADDPRMSPEARRALRAVFPDGVPDYPPSWDTRPFRCVALGLWTIPDELHGD